MRLRYKNPFIFKNENYEIRVFSDGWHIKVQAFKGDRPANGYSYFVDLPTAFDLEKLQGISAIEALVSSAKGDVESEAWKKVEDHLASLSKEERDRTGCSKCESRNVMTSIVDRRKMFECQDCGNIWYENRGSGNAYEHSRDEILDDVENHGYADQMFEGLLNVEFRKDEGSPSTEDQIRNWCHQNKLQWETIHKPDAHGKIVRWIRFSRKAR